MHRYQLWRLVTPVFLHSGVIHIAMNMYTQVRARRCARAGARARRHSEQDGRRSAKGVRIRIYATRCRLSRTRFAPIQRHHASHRSGRSAGFPQASAGAGKRQDLRPVGRRQVLLGLQSEFKWGRPTFLAVYLARRAPRAAPRSRTCFAPGSARAGKRPPPPAQTIRIRGLDRSRCASSLACADAAGFVSHIRAKPDHMRASFDVSACLPPC